MFNSINHREIKITMSYHLTPVRRVVIKKIRSAGKDGEKRESLCLIDGNAHWHSHYEKLYGDFLKKLKTELPYDPGIPLLDIYPKKTKL